ncbi:GntR family transcriptional regulator [Nocardia cyriacigeorgica]|uniref:GntR family transcriptional regulator n=1 Tax=Nocardia cyriacigeorgica TaxID=135487 RepID=UPI001895A667|nr:GntR family transcriptional regulator [Nocardia cyriacigeorgica]MBF6098975.1 GntR family transcriptional regulator [Nocardia cyriacigeorgica]MBF6159469.1 GntR family transcriptional regulator [Nocardia cyriacigeorgica]MBF6198552.1 GntR family transcriptional regulator [Nocardia cyriacigeorgica]MBF6515007.1 GntR family transcriptional regulator [Nocardia cyriacigeorgica]
MPEIEEVLPKYLQIAGYLRDQIVRGDLPPGGEVPSVRELAAQWHVARPTASKALDSLRQQGLVESRRGSGTYVRASQAAPRARERYERAAALGTMYSDSESVAFPFVGIVDAPAHVADALGLAAGSAVIQRRRVISGQSGPVELSTSWFDASLAEPAPRLLKPERLRGGTVRYLADVLGIRSAYARDQVCARAATADERQVLGLPEYAPTLVYWLTAYDAANDRPIQFDEAIYPPEHWSFRQEYPITL